MNDPSKVESILLAALEQATAEARSAYLDDVCKGNPALREHVNRLLAAHPKAVEFLEQPAAPAGEKTGVYVPSEEQSGSVVAGRYKLLEKIGEGGMGEVWVADQLEPIHRRVALKLIKPGMDSRSVLARFEAERQALAVMDHPNIAKVLDAATTADGRPYFVMELVKGTPITEFCDARRLTPKQRLELFVPVCQAIQHAHTKGIIHRDIKPSNVLVALHDERPVPKVIDFGVAKAFGQQLTEKTLYTGFGNLVGTPAYMAPEQATFNQLDIDTRADVYALGVLLYELLAGSPPVEPERMKKAALDEVLRLVRDEEPPRPSQRLSTSQAKASIAATRQSDPIKLAQLIRGELDWIVMKALEKDRNRRYETANGFATDVQRYLAGETVQAVPPSTAYRLKKFARKNRALLLTASAFAGLLLAAAMISGSLAVKARRAEAVAEEKRIEAEENAKSAKESGERAFGLSLDLATRATELETELQRSELTNASRQVDLDLIACRTSDRAGILRLCRTSKAIISSLGESRIPSRVEFKGRRLQLHNFFKDEVRQLREFVTATVLTLGQEFAPLLPPLIHDGMPVTRGHSSIDREISPNHQTFFTWGAGGTARLWDLWTARQIALLRHDNEKVIHCNYSSDGLTIFTLDDTGVIRFWDSTNGVLRAETQLPPDLYAQADNEALEKTLRETQIDFWQPKKIHPNDCVVVGKDRILTRHVVVKQRPDTGNEKVFDQFFFGPPKLWDTTTGRLVTPLDVPDSSIDGLQFLEFGRWITTLDNPSTVMVFSSTDGRLVSRMVHAEGRIVTGVHASPSNRRVVTLSQDAKQANRELAFWDTDSWTRIATASLDNKFNRTFKFLNDELFVFWDVTDIDGFVWIVYHVNAPTTPVATFGAHRLVPPVDHLFVRDVGTVVDAETGLRLTPPPGRRFHPALAKFAVDGRFVVGCGVYGNTIIDTLTERQFDVPMAGIPYYMAGIGHAWVESRGRQPDTIIRRFPSVEQLDIPASHLELWAQVAVRGELGSDGEFVKWNEQLWEKKRQELAALPAPYPNFPFPGHVASDRLHWLRSEYNSVPNDAEKRRLAQELLRRAEANGDQAEAIRWRAALAPVVPKADPAALPASK